MDVERCPCFELEPVLHERDGINATKPEHADALEDICGTVYAIGLSPHTNMLQTRVKNIISSLEYACGKLEHCGGVRRSIIESLLPYR